MKVDPFDFLRKGEANLTKASSYLKTNGYRIQWLAQPDRYRLAVNGKRPDLARQFLQRFKTIYRPTEFDQRALDWMFVYRLLGGYREALQNPALYPATKHLQAVIRRALRENRVLVS